MIRPCALTLGLTGAIAWIVAPVAFVAGSSGPAWVLTASGIVGVGAAAAAHRWLSVERERSPGQRLRTVAAMWLVFSGTAALVTVLAVLASPDDAGASALRDPLSALFEASSGTSTTGLTMLDDPSLASDWLQLWRSLLQWFGGLGVVVFASLVAEPSGDRDSLVDDEWGELPGQDAFDAARRIGLIVGALTLFAVVGLVANGEPVWRALNHGLTAAATGGFTIDSDSLGGSSSAVQAIMAITIIVSAMSFGTLWDTARRGGTPIWRRTQVRIAALLTSSAVVASLVVADGQPLGGVVFNSISASTTAGFSVGDGYREVAAIAAIAMASMMIGGAAGSTAGGLKIARLGWLAKSAARWSPRSSSIGDGDPYHWDDKEVEAHDGRQRIVGAAAIATTWVAVLVIGVVVLLALNPTEGTRPVVFDAISATSGVGLSSGFSGRELGGTSKLILTTLMIVGRLEITAVAALIISPVIKVPKRLGVTTATTDRT